MRNDNYTDFDLELRSMLADAEVEAPSGVWEGVCAELDRKKVVALRWRRAAAGFAAAAAIVAGVVIATNRPQSEAEVQESLFAESVEQAPVQTTFVDEDVVESIEEQISRVKSFSAQYQQPEGEESYLVPTAEGEEQEAASSTTPAKKEMRPSDNEIWSDPFAQMEWEDAHRKDNGGLDWTVGGNVLSNDATARSVKRGVAAVAPLTTGVSEKSTSTYFVPVSFGVGARYHVSEKVSIGTGLEYTLLSRTFTGLYTQVNDGIVRNSVLGEVTNNLHYIGIPLNVFYDIISSGRMTFYVYGGGMMEKGISNNFVISGTNETIRYRESVPGLQWSATLGTGVEYALTDNLGLYLDPSARYYFDCGQPSSVRTAQPFAFNFEIGLRFGF